MPTSQQPSVSSSQQLSLTEADQSKEPTKQDVSLHETTTIPSTDTKRRKWQSPKVQKIYESSLIGEDVKDDNRSQIVAALKLLKKFVGVKDIVSL